MLTSLLLSVMTLHVIVTSSMQSKEKLTFVMMTESSGLNSRKYRYALSNTASRLNLDVDMAWHANYQLQTRYGHLHNLQHSSHELQGYLWGTPCACPFGLRNFYRPLLYMYL